MTTAALLLQAEQAIWRILNDPAVSLTDEQVAQLRRVRCRIALARSGA